MGDELDQRGASCFLYIFGYRHLSLGNRSFKTLAKCHSASGGVYALNANHAVFQEVVAKAKY